MQNGFNTLLVPVDFTLNTKVAIAKAMALAAGGATVHLVHVIAPLFCKRDRYEECVKNMQDWKKSIEETAEGVTVHCSIKQSFFLQRALQKTAAEVQPDLIVIAKSTGHKGVLRLNVVQPVRLAEACHVPVLTVKPGALRCKLKTVVIPVTGGWIEGKTQILEALCLRERPNIHLITFAKSGQSPPELSASALLQMYQWLKNTLHCPVEYATVRGGQNAKAILAYAEKANADVLVVHPNKETRLGWRNKHISDVLPRSSRIQVLAIGNA